MDVAERRVLLVRTLYTSRHVGRTEVGVAFVLPSFGVGGRHLRRLEVKRPTVTRKGFGHCAAKNDFAGRLPCGRDRHFR